MLREGFWRRGNGRPETADTEGLPWPEPDPSWDGRTAFLLALSQVESRARKEAYRGWSTCRLCGGANGSEEYSYGGWEWPSGFAHYIRDHMVRPTPGFEQFILSAAEDV